MVPRNNCCRCTIISQELAKIGKTTHPKIKTLNGLVRTIACWLSCNIRTKWNKIKMHWWWKSAKADYHQSGARLFCRALRHFRALQNIFLCQLDPGYYALTYFLIPHASTHGRCTFIPFSRHVLSINMYVILNDCWLRQRSWAHIDLTLITCSPQHNDILGIMVCFLTIRCW